MPEPIRILELRSVRGTGGGPEKTLLAGAAGTDPSRFAVTVCYIRDARDDTFFIGNLAAKLSIDYVEVVERHSFDPSIWPALKQLVRDRQIDIVHAHDYKTDLIALALARSESVVPLATAHGWTGHSWREHIYYLADKRLLARFPRVIAVSADIRRTLIAAGAIPESVCVVLNGIDPAAFSRQPARGVAERAGRGFGPGDAIIGAVGRLERQKRFDLLIEAFAAVSRGRKGLYLLIAGDGSLRQPLQALAERLAPNTVRLVGHQADVSGFHHLLDVFVQSSDYEGTPNAVLEAMALETPVVATDVGGTSELVRAGVDGLLVPAGSVSALTTAIQSALENPAAAAGRARAARHRVERHLSFETRMRAVEDICEKLMKGRLDATLARASA
jgi:glycosyltransferase involved in cell wall biosynthesis